MTLIRQSIPHHLKRYIVEQNYEKYTAKDHTVWRFIIKQFRYFLPKNAHKCYLDGLEKTGISKDHIPRISDISQKLENYGWKAVPVSGFIPPAAFMELQALGYLPIASEMRTLDQINYTPAPDIVHEAAGHAPILIDPDFAHYLKSYAQIAHKALINKEDLELYQAIRILSDLKEGPSSSNKEIRQANEQLKKISAKIKEPSEAALLARMNWWTAEYGLIGDLQSPKIYGAGLLSSIAEARTALTPQVKKIPFSLECLNYAYDITEPQPQLFVAESFEALTQALTDMTQTMAFTRGGSYGLKLAKKTQTVNTIEYNSGLQIGGLLSHYKEDASGPIYIHTQGPTQICYQGKLINGHDKNRHAHGFGSPVGKIKGFHKCLSEATPLDLENLNLKTNAKGTCDKNKIELCFQSGVSVRGKLIQMERATNGNLLIITFSDCHVTYQDETLFDPTWGEFDMAVGSFIRSVFSGPGDRQAYGETDNFINQQKPSTHTPSKAERESIELYQKVKNIRSSMPYNQSMATALKNILDVLDTKFPTDWLLRLEILETSYDMQPSPAWQNTLKQNVKEIANKHKAYKNLIYEGLQMAYKLS